MKELLVFVTVGTDHHPFDRLVGWADSAHTHPRLPSFFIQWGTSTAPAHASGSAFVNFDEMAARMGEAAAVVTHGGPATIMQVRQAGLVPIVVPRRQPFGEHVDDHQWRFARRLGELGEAVLVEDQEAFRAALELLTSDPAAFRLTAEQTGHREAAIAEFERLIGGLLLSRRSGRRR